MAQRVQVLLVEDDLDLATSVIEYLELEEMDCDFAANGQAGLELALANPPQVILLDINMPQMNGLEVCAALRQQGCDIPVLMLTARDTLDDKIHGFDAGTDDYLVKPFAMAELVIRIRALARRRSAQSRRLRLGDLELNLSEMSACRAGVLLQLSPIGWRIVETLMRRSPEVVSKRELELAVWQGEPPDSNALKVHLFRVRQKVDKPFEYPLIHTVPNYGFAMRDDHGQS